MSPKQMMRQYLAQSSLDEEVDARREDAVYEPSALLSLDEGPIRQVAADPRANQPYRTAIPASSEQRSRPSAQAPPFPSEKQLA